MTDPASTNGGQAAPRMTWHARRHVTRPGDPDFNRPLVGTIGEEALVGSLLASGSGWVHVDGRAVSSGSAGSFDPLLEIESTRHVLDPQLALFHAILRIQEHKVEAERRAHIARHGSESGFELWRVMERVDAMHPLFDIDLVQAGWHPIQVAREHGRFVVDAGKHSRTCPASNGVPGLGLAIGEIVGELRAGRDRTGDGKASLPGAIGDAEAYEGLTAAAFEGMENFVSYDEDTRTLRFTDLSVTVTLPGGLDPEAALDEDGPRAFGR